MFLYGGRTNVKVLTEEATRFIDLQVNKMSSFLCQYLNISSTAVEEHAFTSLT
jgi:hypothetical protein